MDYCLSMILRKTASAPYASGRRGEERRTGHKEFNPVEIRIFWLRYLDFGENLCRLNLINEER